MSSESVVINEFKKFCYNNIGFNLPKLIKISIILSVLSFVVIGALPSRYAFLSLIPLVLVIFRGRPKHDLSEALIALTMVITFQVYYSLALFPLYWILGKYALLSAYIPIYMIGYFYRKSNDSVSETALNLETLVWDTPLLIWMYFMSLLGVRPFPFYSVILPNLLLGSLPLAGTSDVATLRSLKLTGIVNMCREFNGLVSEYNKLNIKQHHQPVGDVLVPTLSDVMSAVQFIHGIHSANPDAKVFVHCKAGVGRSSCVVLCYLLSLGHTVDDAITLIKQKRPSVDPNVTTYSVVKLFVEKLKENGNDFHKMAASHKINL